jgi:hypothetical protein
MGQGKTTWEDEGSKKIGTQKGKKYTTHPKQAKGAQETAPNPITQEPGGNKRPVVQAGGVRKKTKAHQASLDYMITKDDGENIVRMVQYCLVEYFYHATHHRDQLQNRDH